MIDQYPSANGVLTSLIWRKTASGGETSLSGYDNANQALSYTPGQEQVYLNGILLVRGDDYTATNGTSITGLSALSSGDFIQVNCYNNFSVASVPSTSITGSITSSQVDSTIVTTTGSQTLTNKTLTTPTLTTPRFGSAGEIDDTNGNELIKFPTTVASAVNEITVTNAAASGTPSISATGDDTNISLNLVAKGSGTVQAGGVPVVTTTGSQTLTNKTLTSPTITGASGVINNTLTTTTGDIIYASSANTPARLGIGSSNQVLTVSGGIPSWATPSSGGMTILASATPSGTSTTLNITPTGYNYLIVDFSLTTNGASYPLCRINGDTASNYRQLAIDYAGYGTAAVRSSYSLTAWNLHLVGQNGIGNGSQNRTILYIYAPNSTTLKLGQYAIANGNDSGYQTLIQGVCSYDSSSAISSITISGNNITGGTITIWGVK
jgi:hypothetical protein